MCAIYRVGRRKRNKTEVIFFFFILLVWKEKERSEADEGGRRSFLIVGRGKIGKVCLRDCNGYNHDFPASKEGGEILLLTTVELSF